MTVLDRAIARALPAVPKPIVRKVSSRYIAGDTLEEPVFRVDAATGQVTRLTRDGSFGNVHALAGGGALAPMNSIAAPVDIYRLEALR